jgi:hypothetical protein
MNNLFSQTNNEQLAVNQYKMELLSSRVPICICAHPASWAHVLVNSTIKATDTYSHSKNIQIVKKDYIVHYNLCSLTQRYELNTL